MRFDSDHRAPFTTRSLPANIAPFYWDCGAECGTWSRRSQCGRRWESFRQYPWRPVAADSSVGTVNGTEAFRALGDLRPSPPSSPHAFAASRPTLFVHNQRTPRRPPTIARRCVREALPRQ
jgi:hypothetical protein